VEQAQNDSGVVLGTFPVNSVPATVLFDLGASHSFITDRFVTKHNLSMGSMKNPLIVSSPGGEMKTGYICPQVKISIMGVDFLANLVVLKSWGIDVILGMDWLQKHDGVIQCRKKSVLLTSPQGERIEYVGTPRLTVEL
jgi:predicted aspartyl protease